MCLAVPFKIVALKGDEAWVELDGIQHQANVALIPNPQVGDYVLVHAGFAIQKWSEEDVRIHQALCAEMEQAFHPPLPPSGDDDSSLPPALK